MAKLKRLIHEIHHRSLWQVMGVFLAASWGVIQVVDFLTREVGLPVWTPTMAFALLLIGFPVVLATAIVQEGRPGQGEAGDAAGAAGAGDAAGAAGAGDHAAAEPAAGAANRAVDPEPDAAAAAAASSSSGAPGPFSLRRLLTWRHALLGGVAAFALLGFSVAVYFFMWSTGIGPVGNLVAQGVITEGERVVLATFGDDTDEGLGQVVTEALRVDLTSSPILTLVEGADVAPVLARMQLEPGTPLTAELAREVAVREGIEAVLDGEVARLGSGYLITAALRDATGRSLASFRVTAAGPGEIIASVDRLSREIREKSGESLRSVRAGEPLEQVTTRSLEALRLFTEADRAFDRSEWGRTVELLEEAVALDPEFAMAWRRMAAALGNMGADPGRSEHAATQAFLHRSRLTPRERYLAEAYYHSNVEVDRARTIAAYENVLRLAPDDRSALNNLGNEYMAVEDFERATELYRRAVDGPGRTNTAFTNLIIVRIVTGDLDGAAAAYREYEAAYPDDRRLSEAEFAIRFMGGDLAGARAVAEPEIHDLSLPAFLRTRTRVQMAMLAYWEGRLDEGRSHLLAAERLAAEVGHALPLAQRYLTAHFEALLGDREWALRHAREALEDGSFQALDPTARPWGLVARTLSTLGQHQEAASILAAWEDHLDERAATLDGRIGYRLVRLVADVEAGRERGGLEKLRDLAAAYGCRPSCGLPERALVTLAEGRIEEAIPLLEELREAHLRNISLNASVRTRATLLLGPLYEEVGDTARAIEAYRRVTEQWSNADERGMERVREAEARIAALSSPD